jgi:hypothetical protein
VPVVCTKFGPVAFDFAYTYDADGDNGRTPGLFGVAVLNHPVDPEGFTAPTQVRISSYSHFSGHQAFEDGGDPTNDFERYELLSQRGSERNADLPRDYRMLVTTGAFRTLLPESTLVVQIAFAIGAGEEAFANVANAKLAFSGAWFNLDNDKDGMTGYSGRETMVVGPRQQVWIDSCRKYRPPFEIGCDFARVDPLFNKPFPILEAGDTLWTNSDCVTECLFKGACGYTEQDSLKFRTGVDGRESPVHWIMAAAPPPPSMRLDDHARDGIVIYWDSFSEEASDNITQLFDFEGYQVYRADDWTRPLGTSTTTGPPTELWNALFQADVVNSFGEDVGLDQLRYEPLGYILSAIHKRDFINTLREHILENPDDEPPCPQGVTVQVCDTLKALARWEAGVIGGRQYYRYVDRSVHLGRPYFYSVVAFDHGIDSKGRFKPGLAGVPSSNFQYVEPQSSSLAAYEYKERAIYVVPNPATRESMAAWALDPTNDDPSGTKVEFRNVPRSKGTIRVYTLAGDLVKEIHFNGHNGIGTVKWDLVSRNGQDITSGVYLYSVEADGFDRAIGKFTVIR